MLKHKNSLVQIAALISVVAVLIALPGLAFGKDKKDKNEPLSKPKKNFLEVLDYSKLVWPAPPAITRVRYLNFFSGEKYVEKGEQKKKVSWKDRMAGIAAGQQSAQEKPRYQLVMPYGMAVDSKNRLYIADRKVSAIFRVNTETGEFDMIKNGVHARFGAVIGVAVDDADRIFVSDSVARRVMVFSPELKPEAVFSEGMASPGGLAIDNENRFLYVADSDNDQVLVYDADAPYKLLRRIGTAGKKHSLTEPGQFAMPTNVAVDSDGNLYVTDTLNSRIQIFDAEGNFLKTFGKPGDGPGFFARPKGLAVDADKNIWVADAVQNRVQVFNQEGQLLMWIGGTGIYPGQFRTLAGLTIDKNHRVFTSEQYPGRVQFFRYVTEEEVKVEVARREAEEKPKKDAQGKDDSPRASQDSTAKQR